jgi:hypothetical protein
LQVASYWEKTHTSRIIDPAGDKPAGFSDGSSRDKIHTECHLLIFGDHEALWQKYCMIFWQMEGEPV